MQSLHIQWELSTPMVVPEFPIHLDGILAYARVVAAEDAGETDPWSFQDHLPLAKAGTGEDWIWKASRLRIIPQGMPIAVQMIRKLGFEDLALDQGRVYDKGPKIFSSGTGQYKAYDMRVLVRWVAQCEAWCIGDKTAIEALLPKIQYLGKLGRNGWGRIKSYTIAVDQAAETMWTQRVLPSSMSDLVTDYVPVMTTIRPPYWDVTQRVEALEPGW